jgi:hypothetical protein
MTVGSRRDRVREHTPADVDAQLDDEARDRLFIYSELDDREIAAGRYAPKHCAAASPDCRPTRRTTASRGSTRRSMR